MTVMSAEAEPLGMVTVPGSATKSELAVEQPARVIVKTPGSLPLSEAFGSVATMVRTVSLSAILTVALVGAVVVYVALGDSVTTTVSTHSAVGSSIGATVIGALVAPD